MSLRPPAPSAPTRCCVVPPRPCGGETRYWSDTHFGHARILALCARPFASVAAMDAQLLSACLAADAEGARLIHAGDLAWGVWRETMPVLPPLVGAAEHLVLVGNHDTALCWARPEAVPNGVHPVLPLRAVIPTSSPSAWPAVAEPLGPRVTDWSAWTHRIVGDPAREAWPRTGLLIEDVLDGRTVTVLVTHAPSAELLGADINLHGHIHDNWDRSPEAHAAAYPFLAGSPRHVNASVERLGYAPRTLQWIVDAQRARGGIP